MRGDILGIDLGTSSVKLLLLHSDGTRQKSRAVYRGAPPEAWLAGIAEAANGLKLQSVCAIGLSAQVGTYLVDDKHVLSWFDKAGRDELAQIRACHSPDSFLRELAMPHPSINSYPIPRLLYLCRQFPGLHSVCQPKDFLCKILTGNWVTDKYSWRGLANPVTGQYSDYFLDYLGVDRRILPNLMDSAACAGLVTDQAAKNVGLPQGVPVYVGMNDFFASLLGMGAICPGDGFDITGTSEHLGVIRDTLAIQTAMVSGPFLSGYVHYGVTASSGPSLAFGLREFGLADLQWEQCLESGPPIFTPYLNGERAPIFDSDATGVFLGVTENCTRQAMAYSVMEGIAFCLRQIYENLGSPRVERFVVSGGAAKNAVLNRLKAELLDAALVMSEENDTSALGAAMLAAVGCGQYSDLSHAVLSLCHYAESVVPIGLGKDKLLNRYEIFKQIYPSVKNLCKQFREVSE